MIVVSDVLVVIGVLLLVLATLGLVRLPDVFTRAHAVGKAESLGLAVLFVGLALRPEADTGVVLRLVALLGFAFIGNPTAVHAVTRAARRAGVVPWQAARDATSHDADDAEAAHEASDREERP